MAWKHNRYDNPNLNHQQADGIAADIAAARKALDALEAACATEHPNRLLDYVNDVTRYMAFASSFCAQAAVHCDKREADLSKLREWERSVREGIEAKRIA